MVRVALVAMCLSGAAGLARGEAVPPAESAPAPLRSDAAAPRSMPASAPAAARAEAAAPRSGSVPEPAPAPERAGAEAPSPDAPRVRLTRADAWFALAAATTVGAIAFADLDLRDRATAADGPGARDLARGVRALGAPEVLGPVLVAGYLAGRAFERPRLAAASGRIAVSAAVAGAATGALKLAVGRVRPQDAAAEPEAYRPFSSHASFPSGHASLAFATAAALDAETEARWVPWVAYPLAGLVGWSRMRDDKHWASDVAAGAALGFWTGRTTDRALRARAGRRSRVSLAPTPGAGAAGLSVRVEY